MRTNIALLLTLPLIAANPASGQDFLGPIQNFVDDLTAKPQPKAAPPKPPVPRVEAPTPPPVPRPRPPSVPDGPVVPEVSGTTEPTPPPPAPSDGLEPTEAPADVAKPAEIPQPDRVYQAACPAVISGQVEAKAAPPLSEGICGERSPLEVTGVLVRGRIVPLSRPITTNCAMASALPGWLDSVDGYAEAMLGSALAEVDTGTSYMCRNRNNGATGFTSEHGFANAVDVTGFTLADGRSIAVAADWMPAAADEGRLLRLAHDAACAGFTTVLGPEANAEHQDHLHLDLGCHGASCTARLCE